MIMWTILLVLAILHRASSHGIQPLSRIAIHKATLALDNLAYVKASPTVLGLNGQNTEWVTVEYSSPNPSMDDWIGVFSPANFSASTCPAENPRVYPPLLCSAPIKFQYANYTSPDYKVNGKGSLKLQLINQRSDFSFALFSNGFLNPKLVAVSNTVSFANPNAPVYPCLAQGKQWDEMTVTWTSGYGIDEAEPFVQWGPKGGHQQHSPAVTLTFDRSSVCGAPARTIGWRDPGFIHTSFLKELWLNRVYTYKLGHRLFNSTYVWSQEYQFRASPFPGQNSLQRVVIFGDMGKDEADGSNEYNNFQRGSLNATKQLIKDLKKLTLFFTLETYVMLMDIFHNGTNLLHRLSLLHQLCLICLQVVTMNVIGPELDLSMRTMILEANVACWLKLCFLFLLKTELNIGTPLTTACSDSA
ncbi:hypothetical protein ES288_D12G192800v1 [Gossypium darwinii]|nr:hypothetical protein ES288_D12G192800v1 [Gossypium darwinii]